MASRIFGWFEGNKKFRKVGKGASEIRVDDVVVIEIDVEDIGGGTDGLRK